MSVANVNSNENRNNVVVDISTSQRINEIHDDEKSSFENQFIDDYQTFEDIMRDTTKTQHIDNSRRVSASTNFENVENASRESNMSTLSKHIVLRLKEKNMQIEIANQKTRIAKLKRDVKMSREHRREHSDDHYRNEFKRRFKSKSSDMQKCKNFDDLCIWIKNCEIQFRHDERIQEYSTNDDERLKYVSTRLKKERKTQWRIHVEEDERRDENSLTWNQFVKYVKNMISRFVIRRAKAKRKLENAKQRVDQNSIANFDAYLTRLYANTNDKYDDAIKKQHLRNKMLLKIQTKSLRNSNCQKKNIFYQNLREIYVDIEMYLQRLRKILKIDKNKSKSKSSHETRSFTSISHDNRSFNSRKDERDERDREENNEFSHDRNNSIEIIENFDESTQSNLSNRFKESNDKRDANLDIKITCWFCQKQEHKTNNSICENYDKSQKARNKSIESRKVNI